MDTRKLTYRKGHEPHNQALIYEEETGVDVAVTYHDEGGKDAAEMVRRWNSHLETLHRIARLRALLRSCLIYIPASGDEEIEMREAIEDALKA